MYKVAATFNIWVYFFSSMVQIVVSGSLESKIKKVPWGVRNSKSGKSGQVREKYLSQQVEYMQFQNGM